MIRAIVTIFGCTSKSTFASLFDFPIPSFFTVESMATIFSLLLLPILASFGPIDREFAWFIVVPGVRIGLGIDNSWLRVDTTKCIRSGFLTDNFWSVSLSNSLTIMGSSKVSV